MLLLVSLRLSLLRNIKARTIIEALVNFFSWFGLPKQVQHDQGTNFFFFQEVMCELGVSLHLLIILSPKELLNGLIRL